MVVSDPLCYQFTDILFRSHVVKSAIADFRLANFFERIQFRKEVFACKVTTLWPINHIRHSQCKQTALNVSRLCICKTALLHVAHVTAQQPFPLADLVIKHKHMHAREVTWPRISVRWLYLGSMIYLGFSPPQEPSMELQTKSWIIYSRQ